MEKQMLSVSPFPPSPVCIRSNLHHSWPLPIQHLLGICETEEVKLHVDMCRWILPGLKRICIVFQNDLLMGDKGRWG